MCLSCACSSNTHCSSATFHALVLMQVREATSNDPWGPSSSQMADISDLTYNVVACNEIMTMLWKRLKDDRNWRHIHKVRVKSTRTTVWPWIMSKKKDSFICNSLLIRSDIRWFDINKYGQHSFKLVCVFSLLLLQIWQLNSYKSRFICCCCFLSNQSLTLLEYLLKTGDDRVLLKMKDNIYIVKALTEYRFVEKDGKDQVISASHQCIQTLQPFCALFLLPLLTYNTVDSVEELKHYDIQRI